MAKVKFGYMAHADCGTRVLVRVNEKETLSAQCDECDSTDYAQKGTGKHARWLAKIERIEGAKPAADVKPGEKPGEKKGEKKGAGIW